MVTRGFGGRQPPHDVAGRLPPGQYLTEDFPVLSAGPNPRVRLDDWKFTLKLRAKPVAEWSWAEFNALPQIEDDARHPLRDGMVEVRHGLGRRAGRRYPGRGRHRAADRASRSPIPIDGYTTNVPTADLIGGKAMVALKYEGKPITADHGGPARLLVPHLYFWKSAKWLNGLQFTDTDTPASGSCAAITSMATRGASSATPMTEAPAGVAAHRPARWQPATITAISRLTPRVMSFRFMPSQPFAYIGRPACRRAADGARRLHRAAQLFDRLGAGSRRGNRTGHREARGRRGLALLP